jgi:hypothetical protein
MKSLIKKILLEESQSILIKETQEYLDSLLDKISEKGMESLTPKEKVDLTRLSQGEDIEPEDDEQSQQDYEQEGEDLMDLDRNKMFMHYVMQEEVLNVDGKDYYVEVVEEPSGEHIRVSGPDSDFICSPFFEGHEGIAIQTSHGQALLLKVKENPQTSKEMMTFVQKFYESYLPKIIRKVSSLSGLN